MYVLGASGAGGLLPPGLFSGDILVWNGVSWVRDFTFVKSTQTTWSVNTATGSDLNIGTAASPLATYEEFFRRWSTVIVDDSVAAITITFIGDPPVGTQLLLDGATFLGPTVVTVSGTMTQTDSGSITAAFVTWDGTVAGANGRRGLLTDGAQDFTAVVLQRIRMTSGAANGSVSNIMSLGGGVTLANVGQFCSVAPATTNPAINDTYVVETPDVTFNGYQIHPNGNATFIIRDLEFVAASASRSGASVADNPSSCLFFGCRFVSTSSFTFAGKARFAGCSFEGSLTVLTDTPNVLNSCIFGLAQVNGCINTIWEAVAFDGGTARNAALIVANGAFLEVIGGSGNFALAFYGVTNGSSNALVLIQDASQLALSNAAGNFIGATGNATTDACIVFNNSFGSAVTLPKANGVAAGTDLVLAGAAAIAWAFAQAAAPNNAAFNARA